MWKHETPIDPSPFASDGPYTHARIAKLDLDFRGDSIQLWIEHGKLENGNFVAGKASRQKPQRYPISRKKAGELLGTKDLGKDLDKVFFEYLAEEQTFKGSMV